MELFKLFGTIALNNAEANRGIDETSEKAKGASDDVKGLADESEQTESKMGKVFSKIGSAAAKVGKTIAVGLAAAGAAVVGVGKKALDSYADYEQLVGGVETLFKDNADTVIANSQRAYQTAGMSANDYMETVTGFSASLLQSLGGDTEAAAKKADMAIIDMSDNANKMGTSIESIQTAYQGFAKQNYTMLDNPKLGYGGTKEEMERLLEDATKLSGVEYDISSYADIVDAIHVVQTEMGITGTTAKEASSTISGSISAAKASWQNLLTGLADDTQDLDVLVNNFFESIVTVGDNIIPRIGIVLNGITGLIQKLAPKIISAIPGIMQQVLPSVVQGATALLQAFVGVLPDLARMILGVLPDLIEALETVFKGIVDALPDLIEAIAQALPTLIPQLITAIIDMVVYLMEHFSEIIQPIIEALPDIIISIVDAMIDNLPALIEGLISLVLGIVEAIPDIIMGLIDALPTIIEKVITGLLNCIPQLIEGVIQLVIALVTHLPEIIMGLIEAIPKIIEAIVTALINAAPALFEGFAKIFGGAWEVIQNVFSAVGEWFSEVFSAAWEGIKSAWSAVGDFFSGIWDGIVGIFSAVGEWFGDIFSGAWDAITSVWDAVTGFFSGIWDGIVNVFSGVGEWFDNIFQGAWDAITGIFSGIGEWFSNVFDGLVNIVKAPINWIIDGINVLIDGLNMLSFDIPDWVPIVGGRHFGFDISHIAHLAEGGVVEGLTPLVAGEDGAEAIVPLENNTGWINRVATQLHEITIKQPMDARDIAANTGIIQTFKTEVGDRIKNLETLVSRILDTLLQWFPELLEAFDVQLLLDGDTVVAELTPKVDRELGMIIKRKERG